MGTYDADPRWGEVGRVLVEHSTQVCPGERVMIAMSEVESYPLARGVFEACVAAGAYPQVQFLSEELRHAILARGDDTQLAWVPEIEAYGMQWADVYIGLRGAFELDVHADISAERLAVNQAVQGRVSTLRWQNTRWSLVRVPNQAFADQAGVPLEKVTEMFFAGCLLDWDTAARAWEKWVDRVAGGRMVEIQGQATDLRFSIEGRKGIVADGRTNMPDGELMTAPVTETIDGYIASKTLLCSAAGRCTTCACGGSRGCSSRRPRPPTRTTCDRCSRPTRAPPLSTSSASAPTRS
jgi:aminopeptidase